MLSLGGGSVVRCTPAFWEWPWTTWAFQVGVFLSWIHFQCSLLTLATSVDVEWGFSRGRLLLTHVRSRLSLQATRALLCLGSWSLRGYINDSDLQAAALMADVEGAEEELEEGWDKILLYHSIYWVDTYYFVIMTKCSICSGTRRITRTRQYPYVPVVFYPWVDGYGFWWVGYG